MKHHLYYLICLAIGLSGSVIAMEFGIRSTLPPQQPKTALPAQPEPKSMTEVVANIERPIKPPPPQSPEACPTYTGCRQWIFFGSEDSGCHLVSVLDIPPAVMATKKPIAALELPSPMCKAASQRPIANSLPARVMTDKGIQQVIWACADGLRLI